MCFDQVTAQQQKQKKLNAAEEAAAADAADRKRRITKGQVQQGSFGGGTEIIMTIPQKYSNPTAGPSDTSKTNPHTALSSLSSQFQDLHGEDEESTVLRQWSKVIGTERIMSHSTQRARSENIVFEDQLA